jgi:hypothetical protein
MSDAAWTVINSIRADGWCRSPCSIRKGCACADAIDKALSAEREACAKLVEEWVDKVDPHPSIQPGAQWACRHLPLQIRMRSDNSN